jgi:ribonuclease Z
MIEITFLGTSSGVPTKNRNTFSVHFKFLNNRFLFDCGEGTQRQLFKAEISPFKIQNVFLSHLHADHVLGLGGLIQTLHSLGREEELNIFGPKGIKEIVEFFVDWGDHFKAGYPIFIHEAKEGLVFKNVDYTITAFRTDHNVPCLGYVFEERVGINLDMKKLGKIGIGEGVHCRELKENGSIIWKGKKIKLENYSKPVRRGKKICMVTDTRPNNNIIKYAKNSDIFICEATHADDLKERSHEYGHMTSKDAARLAKKAGVDKLYLTHFSARYDDEKFLEKEAREIFKKTYAAKDLMKIDL